jgi:hypothetical protein
MDFMGSILAMTVDAIFEFLLEAHHCKGATFFGLNPLCPAHAWRNTPRIGNGDCCGPCEIVRAFLAHPTRSNKGQQRKHPKTVVPANR